MTTKAKTLHFMKVSCGLNGPLTAMYIGRRLLTKNRRPKALVSKRKVGKR